MDVLDGFADRGLPNWCSALLFTIGELFPWESPWIMPLVVAKWPRPLNLSPEDAHFVSMVVSQRGHQPIFQIADADIANGRNRSCCMPQIAFFVGGASAGVGGVGVHVLVDRHNRGPSAADDSAIDDVALYSWVAPITGSQLVKLKTKSPLQIPEENCPTLPDGDDGSFIARFEIKPGGTALTPFGDVSFDLFDGSALIYGVAPESKTLKFELADNSVMIAAVSVQDTLTLQAWEDPLEGLSAIVNFDIPAKEIWRSLMTPNEPLNLLLL